MWRPSGWELLIILMIVLLLFGPGRIGKVAGELAKGIKAFRDGIGGKKEEDQAEDQAEEKEPPKA